MYIAVSYTHLTTFHSLEPSKINLVSFYCVEANTVPFISTSRCKPSAGESHNPSTVPEHDLR